MTAAACDAAAALAGVDVSRETCRGLETLAAELQRWQAIKNLVGPRTLDEVWTRHIADSLQLLPLGGTPRTWLDLGSGAGFPGLVLAIAGREGGLTLHLVESNARKCAFLRQVARLTGAPAQVHQSRLEAVVPAFVRKADVVSARALAPLSDLLAWTEPLLTSGTVALFPKGREAAAELTVAEKTWRFAVEILPSRTDSRAGILRISHLESRR